MADSVEIARGAKLKEVALIDYSALDDDPSKDMTKKLIEGSALQLNLFRHKKHAEALLDPKTYILDKVTKEAEVNQELAKSLQGKIKDWSGKYPEGIVRQLAGNYLGVLARDKSVEEQLEFPVDALGEARGLIGIQHRAEMAPLARRKPRRRAGPKKRKAPKKRRARK